MSGAGERDPHSGYLTTGHDWNGIKELNRPVPRPVWFFLVTTIAFSLVYWVLMPAWPLGVTYTRGLLGIDQRKTVAERLAEGAAQRAAWAGRIETAGFAEIQGDEALMRVVRVSGRTLFGDNCSACHGTGGQGGPGYPSLVDGSWLWGGSPEAVAETLRVGINSAHPETRVAQMPAFGRDGMLEREAILAVAAYVRSLSGTAGAVDAAGKGKEVFAENCASCHGERGEGNVEVGAPDLTAGFWTYGGDLQSVYASVYRGRGGHMPHWEGRLTPVERKILTLYVLDLGAGAKLSASVK